MLTPTVQRSWSPVGVTPILSHMAGGYRKATCIGALTISPVRKRFNLRLEFLPGKNTTSEVFLDFLKKISREISGNLILIIDNYKPHKAEIIMDWIDKMGRIDLEWLPPYAPELNPTEYAWGNLKTKRMANFTAHSIIEVCDEAAFHASEIKYDQEVLKGFFKATGLKMRLN